ncbi:jg16751, partial [Pararge aegeria aegeria]
YFLTFERDDLSEGLGYVGSPEAVTQGGGAGVRLGRQVPRAGDAPFARPARCLRVKCTATAPMHAKRLRSTRGQ